MSVWKSPILYLGILVFVLVAGALVAPFVVNWNDYKPRLEAYGQNLTGRHVTIDGPIAVRLFPIPRLVAEDVRITNLDNDKTVFAAADKIIIDVTLGGLLNGNLEVQSIQVDAPIINIIRRKSGQGNWVMTPSEDLRNSVLLKNVKLENINLNRATIVFRDESKGFEQILQDLDLNLSAPTVLGPWRANGTGFNNGRALNVNLTTSAKEQGQPFRFGLRAAPLDPSFPQYAIDAELKDDAIVGGLRIDVVPQEGVKTNRLTGWRALQLVAKFDANFNTIKLNEISISPRDAKDGSTLIEGNASIDLTNGIAVKTSLKSPRINADQLLGGNSVEAFRGDGIMALANEMFKNLPERVVADISVEATVLTLGEDQIENVALDMAMAKDAARIKRLSGNFPGRSRMLLSGVMFPAALAAELGGKLSFESSDLRNFTTWARPTYKDVLKQYWIGARGRIKGDADINWQGDNLGFENLRYELDGVAGTAEVDLILSEQASVQVKLNTETVDFDNYLLGSDRKAKLPWADLFTFLMGEGETIEKSFDVSAKQFVLNGIVAKSAIVNIISGKAGLDIKHFEFSDVAGANLNVRGQVLKSGTSYIGQLTSDVKASDLNALVQFIGLSDNKRIADVAKNLKSADINGIAKFNPIADGTAIDISFKADTGAMRTVTDGEVVVSPTNNVARVSGRLKIDANDSLSLMQLVNTSATQSGEPAEIAISLDGDLGETTATKIVGKIYNSNFNFDGQTLFSGANTSSQGKLEISSYDSSVLLRALGLNADRISTVTMSGTATLAQTLDVNLGGVWNGQPITLAWRNDETGGHQVDLTTSKLELTSMLSAALLAANEKIANLDTDFLDAEIWIRPEVIILPDGSGTKEAAFGVKSSKGKRVVSLLGQTQGNEPIKLEAELSNVNFMPNIQFKFDGPLALTLLNPISGSLALKLSGQAAGLDLSQMLAGAEASGIYQSSPIKIQGLDIEGFSERVQKVQTDADLKAALLVLEQNASLNFEPSTGNLTLKNGELRLSPVEAAITGGVAQLSLDADLNEREVASALTVRLLVPRVLPPIEILYSGQPGLIKRNIRSSAFASELGFDILARDMQELERIQQEQQRLEQEEAAQQAMDAEKFAAFQAQRAELRLRVRELRVHADLRTKAERKRQQILELLLRDPSLTAAIELDRRRREREVYTMTANGASSPAVISENSSLTPLNFNDVNGVPIQP